MENKETIVRETHYEYGENEKLTGMTIHETITNPNVCDSEGCEDGELLTSEVEVTSEANAVLAVAALALATVGLCLTAMSAIFNRR